MCQMVSAEFTAMRDLPEVLCGFCFSYYRYCRVQQQDSKLLFKEGSKVPT